MNKQNENATNKSAQQKVAENVQNVIRKRLTEELETVERVMKSRCEDEQYNAKLLIQRANHTCECGCVSLLDVVLGEEDYRRITIKRLKEILESGSEISELADELMMTVFSFLVRGAHFHANIVQDALTIVEETEDATEALYTDFIPSEKEDTK